jgi:hypothetical protein
VSSKRGLRRRHCANKRRFSTLDLAQKAARDVMSAGRASSLQGYRCRFCRAFHVGHWRMS